MTAGGGFRLFLFPPGLLAVPLACQRFLHAASLARLEVIGVALYLLDDVLLLDLSLEAPQSIL